MENENWFVRERVVEIGWERQEELLVYWEEERIGDSVRVRLVGLGVQLTILTCDELAGNEVGKFIWTLGAILIGLGI